MRLPSAWQTESAVIGIYLEERTQHSAISPCQSARVKPHDFVFARRGSLTL